MKKRKKELPSAVHFDCEEVACYDDNDITVYSPSESKGVAVVQTICQTISDVSRSHENVKIASLSAKVRIKEIERDFTINFAEEENIHDEVMSNLNNISSAINIINNNPELKSDKDVIINLLDSISTGAKQTTEIRKSKQK